MGRAGAAPVWAAAAWVRSRALACCRAAASDVPSLSPVIRRCRRDGVPRRPSPLASFSRPALTRDMMVWVISSVAVASLLAGGPAPAFCRCLLRLAAAAEASFAYEAAALATCAVVLRGSEPPPPPPTYAHTHTHTRADLHMSRVGVLSALAGNLAGRDRRHRRVGRQRAALTQLKHEKVAKLAVLHRPP